MISRQNKNCKKGCPGKASGKKKPAPPFGKKPMPGKKPKPC